MHGMPMPEDYTSGGVSSVPVFWGSTLSVLAVLRVALFCVSVRLSVTRLRRDSSSKAAASAETFEFSAAYSERTLKMNWSSRASATCTWVLQNAGGFIGSMTRLYLGAAAKYL